MDPHGRARGLQQASSATPSAHRHDGEADGVVRANLEQERLEEPRMPERAGKSATVVPSRTPRRPVRFTRRGPRGAFGETAAAAKSMGSG